MFSLFNVIWFKGYIQVEDNIIQSVYWSIVLCQHKSEIPSHAPRKKAIKYDSFIAHVNVHSALWLRRSDQATYAWAPMNTQNFAYIRARLQLYKGPELGTP